MLDDGVRDRVITVKPRPSKYAKNRSARLHHSRHSLRKPVCKIRGPHTWGICRSHRQRREPKAEPPTQQPPRQQWWTEHDSEGESGHKSNTYELWSEPTSLWEDSCLTVGVTMAGWGMPVVCRVWCGGTIWGGNLEDRKLCKSSESKWMNGEGCVHTIKKKKKQHITFTWKQPKAYETCQH